MLRSTFKKAVSPSLAVYVSISFVLLTFFGPCKLSASIKPVNSAEHWNIYTLSLALIKNTKCTVSVPLCARVALMVSASDRPHDMPTETHVVANRIRKISRKRLL